MATKSFSDQMGNSISVSCTPQRIISLVPSQTELLADLGLDANVVGITKFCVHPPDWLERKAVVGGTKKFHFDAIRQLKPDLIIGNKEENYQQGIVNLQVSYRVWISDIVTLHDAFSMINSIGKITGREVKSTQITDAIISKFNQLKKYHGQSILYLIWRQPWMSAGTGTFINYLLTTIGLRNVVDFQDRYPELREEEIKKLQPDYIFLSSEPYPFKKRHVNEIHRISPKSKIFLVDGEMFSWYGSRLLQAPDYFNSLELD